MPKNLLFGQHWYCDYLVLPAPLLGGNKCVSACRHALSRSSYHPAAALGHRRRLVVAIPPRSCFGPASRLGELFSPGRALQPRANSIGPSSLRSCLDRVYWATVCFRSRGRHGCRLWSVGAAAGSVRLDHVDVCSDFGSTMGCSITFGWTVVWHPSTVPSPPVCTSQTTVLAVFARTCCSHLHVEPVAESSATRPRQAWKWMS